MERRVNIGNALQYGVLVVPAVVFNPQSTEEMSVGAG